VNIRSEKQIGAFLRYVGEEGTLLDFQPGTRITEYNLRNGV
jgi:hypothetical protein